VLFVLRSPQDGQLGLLPFERKETVMRGLSSESVVRLSMLLACAAGLSGVALGQAPGTRPDGGREEEVDFPVPEGPDCGSPSNRLFLDSIDGLIVGRHLAPATFVVPLGSRVMMFQEACLSDRVTWTGAELRYFDETGVGAFCPMDRPGVQSVRVQVVKRNGEVIENACDFEVLDVPIDQIKVAGITMEKLRLGLTEQSSNQETMEHFFGRAISSVRPVGPKKYRTSVDRELTFQAAKLRPKILSGVIEWRVDGQAAGLGETLRFSFSRPGVHRVSVGPTAAPAELEIETYRVLITSHVSNRDIVSEGEPIIFTAVTDPPGYENEITWLSSTKYGTATPVLGSGPTFTVQFDDTWGDDPAYGRFQWLGVKADHTVFNQDQKAPIIHDIEPTMGSPALGGAGTEITVTGENFGQEVADVCQLIKNGPSVVGFTRVGSVAPTTVTSTLEFVVPNATSGQVTLAVGNGAFVDPDLQDPEVLVLPGQTWAWTGIGLPPAVSEEIFTFNQPAAILRQGYQAWIGFVKKGQLVIFLDGLTTCADGSTVLIWANMGTTDGSVFEVLSYVAMLADKPGLQCAATLCALVEEAFDLALNLNFQCIPFEQMGTIKLEIDAPFVTGDFIGGDILVAVIKP
jgi:hypothetical protein